MTGDLPLLRRKYAISYKHNGFSFFQADDKPSSNKKKKAAPGGKFKGKPK